MAITKEQLFTDLQNIGVHQGDCLLVHSSFKAVGECEDGPKTVIEALKAVLTESGTLVMPAFQGGGQYDLLKNFSGFESNHTPSQLGIISETFRKYRGVLRSLSPTHSVCALGPQAEKIIEGHEKCSVTVGKDSPFEKLKMLKAKILLLGVDNRSNTFLHYCENVNGAPTLSSRLFHVTIKNKLEADVSCALYSHLPGLPRNYGRLNSELTEPIQIKGKIGNAESYLLNMSELFDHVSKKIKENPIYLISPFNPYQSENK